MEKQCKKQTAQDKWMMGITRKLNPEGKELTYRGLEEGLKDLMIYNRRKDENDERFS